MNIFFLTTIDTECDKSADWSVRYPLSFRSILEGIPQRLQPLFNRYGVKPTYLLSPEVIADLDSVNQLKNLSGKYELGTHLHSEFVNPEANMNSLRTEMFQGDLIHSLEFEKMKNLTDLFKLSFGYQPTSFRAGRFGMGTRTWPILQQLGYRVDSSVLPLHKIPMKNSTNNFYDSPLDAYFPVQQDYLNNHDSQVARLLEVPVTVHSSLYAVFPPHIRKLLSDSTYIEWGLSKVLGRKKVKPYTLRPSSFSFDNMKFVIDQHIKFFKKNEMVFLTMMFHSNEIIEGASPYCSSTEDVQKLIKSMDLTFQYVHELGVRFISLSDAWNIMNKENVS